LKTKKLVTAAMMTAVMCILAQIAIPLPFTEVPFSLGVLGVFLCGAVLEPKYAAASLLVYDLLGAVGVPVFAGFKGGLGTIAGPTGGFIIAYPFMALTVSLSVKLLKSKKLYAYLIGMTASLIICYGLGTAWFSIYGGKSFITAASLVAVPFIPFDLAKAVIASLAASQLIPRLDKSKTSSNAA
jgi:biotin transport system substrate-specific component